MPASSKNRLNKRKFMEVIISERDPDTNYASPTAQTENDRPSGPYPKIQRRSWKIWKNVSNPNAIKTWIRRSPRHNERIEQGTGSSCPGPMTRAQLIGLRNSGQLNKDCHYVITDYNRGTVGAATILLHAVDENTLSMDVDVKTSFDNLARDGRYDIDLNTITFLADNIDNQVSGSSQVDAFPRGNTTHFDNTVETNGSVTITGGSMRGNTFKANSNTSITGGNFYDNEVKSDANISSQGTVARNEFGAASNTTIATGDFIENVVAKDATVNATTTGDVDNNHFGALSNSTISGSANMDASEVRTDANANISGGSVYAVRVLDRGNLTNTGGTLADSVIEEDAEATFNSQVNYENKIGTSAVFRQVGTGYVRFFRQGGTTVRTNGNVRISNVDSYVSTVNTTGSSGTISTSRFHRAYMQNLQNIPSLTINDSEVGGYALVQGNNATRLYLYRYHGSSGGRILCSAGSRIDSSYCHVSGYGYIQSTQSGGFLRVNYTNVGALGLIRNTTPNTHYVERSDVSAQSAIRFDQSSENCRVYYTDVASGGAVYHTGTSSGCYTYYGSSNSVGQIYTQNSTNARLYYVNASARGHIRALNCTETQLFSNCSATAIGYVEAQNNTARVRFYGVHANSQSIARVQNTSVASNLYYSSFTAYYYLLATLTGGTRSALHGYGRRSYTVTNPPNGTYVQNF